MSVDSSAIGDMITKFGCRALDNPTSTTGLTRDSAATVYIAWLLGYSKGKFFVSNEEYGLAGTQTPPKE